MPIPRKTLPRHLIDELPVLNPSELGITNSGLLVVLEEYRPTPTTTPARLPTSTDVDKKRLFVFSSQDQAGIKRVSDSIAKYIQTARSENPTWTVDQGEPEFLGRLAHTLNTARSSLGWKASLLATSLSHLQEQLKLAAGSDEDSNKAVKVSRAKQAEPRVGFVFTGQGAQWAGMGIQLLERPAFRDSVAKSAAILQSLGCPWDPIDELRKTGDASRLSAPEISQPICTVLQIALVDEIRSWGSAGLSKPVKVVGHSSGEIAAAYCSGALTHHDAIVVAYSRGTASALLPTVAPHLNGAMMAAACPRETAESLIEELGLVDKITVACVNAPASITLSGDSTAVDAMAVALQERKTWCRKLKVQVAYHSSHVATVSSEYYKLMESIEPVAPVDEDGTRMISSVLGEEVSYEQLGPFYWLQNFVSPVLFSDALKELVQPADATEPEIDLLVELGPHSTLGGPIEQILTHHGIQNVAYQAALRRGADAIETSLQMAQELFHQGLSLEVAKVNGDLHVLQPGSGLLTDLPPYPWMHDNKYNVYPRVQKERWHRDATMKSLLGAPTPTMQEKQRVWRGFIRLDDEPWLRGHTVGDTVVFPAAGMISVVLEAAQQLAEPGKAIHALRLRDVSVNAALSILEGVATEIVVTMSRSGNQEGPWWDFTVSSANTSSSQLRDNCRGLITIDYAPGRSAFMIREDEQLRDQKIAQYHDVVQELARRGTTMSKEDFYTQIAKETGFKYGDVFQGCENLHVDAGKTHFDLRVTDIGKTFSQGQSKEPGKRPFLIHAATLDAIFQCWVGATFRDGILGLKPFAPTRLGAMEITMDVPGNPDEIMAGFSTNKRFGFHEQTNDMFLFDKELSKMYISITDFRISELDVTGGGGGGGAGQDEQGSDADVDRVLDAPGASVTYETRWNYSLGLLEDTDLAKVISLQPQGAVAQLLSMLLHERPPAAIIELVQNRKSLGQSIVDSLLVQHDLLPQGAVPASNIRYALVDDSVEDDKDAAVAPLGEPLLLQQAIENAVAADLLVVPPQLLQATGDESLLDNFVRLAKPDAAIVLAVKSRESYTAAASLLESKGWQGQSADAGADDDKLVVAVFRRDENQSSKTVSADKFVIIEPTTPSPTTQDFSKKLQDELVPQGKAVSVTSWNNELTESSLAGSVVISLLELEQPVLHDVSESDFDTLRKLVLASERIVWVTGGDDPSFAIVDGFARTISNETASLRFQTLHLGSPDVARGPVLAARILTSDPSTCADDEFRVVHGMLQTSRVYKSNAGERRIARHLKDATRVVSLVQEEKAKGPLRLAIGRPGLLDTLHFVKDERAAEPLGEDEVEIRVHASSINFKDIMGAMGLVPVPMLGLEASGIVVRTGQAVTRIQPGDRVAAHAYGSHATVVRTHQAVVHKLPDSITFEEGAAINLVHVTAYYALVRLAKLRKGQSVLIHAAAGGVGQAAIQLAKYLGLVIYVTVGSEGKRKLMTERFQIPPEHIFYSRDLSFVKSVERITKGRGVDCILNSLADELLRASWDSSCLAPFGTFVEIGLRDITANSQLDMRPFVKNATFAFCDILNYPLEDLGSVLAEVYQLVEQGHLTPAYPLKAYQAGQVEDVFRVMQQGKHTGKAVLTFNGPDDETSRAPVFQRASDLFRLDAAATYLLVGGMGGLGRSLARSFVAAGARHIAFLSRSGDTTAEAQALIAELAARGVTVRAYRADIADAVSLRSALDQCEQELPPVRGVVQLAMVLRDVVFEKMAYSQWVEPLQPKVKGSRNLHEYFDSSRELDFFVLCSSVSGVVGNPAQAAYAAGNTYQDALAAYRRARGLKAVAVDLGVMLDVGVLAEKKTESGMLGKWEDAVGIPEPVFHGLLKSIIHSQQEGEDVPEQVVTGLGSADVWAANELAEPYYFADARFSPLAITTGAGAAGQQQGGATATVSLASQLASVSSMPEAAQIVTEALVKRTAEILQMPPSEVDPAQPLYRYGVDSLTAIEVRNWISRELKANMALLEIVSAVPIREFAAKIAEKSQVVTITA